ncbi:MAG: glycosyltransferase family 4 protein [Anaerolineales bacterium]
MTLLTFRLIFLAAAISLALSPFFIWAMKRVGLVDIPGSASHKKHANTVPIAGGWVIVFGVILTGLTAGDFRGSEIRTILIPSGVVFLFGLWDDARSIPPSMKFIGQLIAAVIVISLGMHVKLFEPKYNLLNWGLSVLWITGITNAFNFVDSMDGLATGLAGLAAAFFMLATFDSGQIYLSLFSAILVGACIGTYFFNTTPAHFFLGDSGSQWLGFSLASLAIAYNPEGFLRTQSWFVPVLLVGVPIFDTSLVVISRMRRGRAVYKAHFDHTYHRLVAFGMSANRAVLSMHIAALLLGCLAFITISLPPLWANSIYGACVLLWAAVIAWMDSKIRWP